MKPLVYASAFAAILAGCASMPEPITTPEGKQGYSISCGGARNNWSKCYSQATKACGGTYHVLDKSESMTSDAFGPIVSRSFIIQCK